MCRAHQQKQEHRCHVGNADQREPCALHGGNEHDFDTLSKWKARWTCVRACYDLRTGCPRGEVTKVTVTQSRAWRGSRLADLGRAARFREIAGAILGLDRGDRRPGLHQAGLNLRMLRSLGGVSPFISYAADTP